MAHAHGGDSGIAKEHNQCVRTYVRAVRSMSSSPRERRTSKGMRAALAGSPTAVSAVGLPAPVSHDTPFQEAAHVAAAGAGGLMSTMNGHGNIHPRVALPRGSSHTPGIEKTTVPSRSASRVEFPHTLSSTSLSTASTAAAVSAGVGGGTLSLSALGAAQPERDVHEWNLHSHPTRMCIQNHPHQGTSGAAVCPSPDFGSVGVHSGGACVEGSGDGMAPVMKFTKSKSLQAVYSTRETGTGTGPSAGPHVSDVVQKPLLTSTSTMHPSSFAELVFPHKRSEVSMTQHNNAHARDERESPPKHAHDGRAMFDAHTTYDDADFMDDRSSVVRDQYQAPAMEIVDVMDEEKGKDNAAARELFCETLLDLLKGEDRKTALMDAETPSFHENDLWRWALGSPRSMCYESQFETEEEEEETEEETEENSVHIPSDMEEAGQGDCYDTLRMSRSASIDCAAGAFASSFVAQAPKSVQCVRASLRFDTGPRDGMGTGGSTGTSPDMLVGDKKGKEDIPMSAMVDGCGTRQDVFENRTIRSASLPSFSTFNFPSEYNRRLQEMLPQWESICTPSASSHFLSLPTPSRSFSSTTPPYPHQSSSSCMCGTPDQDIPVMRPRRPLASCVPSISVTPFIDDNRGKALPETADPDCLVPGIDTTQEQQQEQHEQHEHQQKQTQNQQQTQSLIDQRRHAIVDTGDIDTDVLLQNDGSGASDDENPQPPSPSTVPTSDDDNFQQQLSSNGVTTIITRVPQQVGFTTLDLCPPDVYARFALPALQEQLLSLGASQGAATNTAVQARASAALQTIIQLRDASLMLPEGFGERMAQPIRNAMAMSIMDFSLAALESRLTNGLHSSTSHLLHQSGSGAGSGGGLVVTMDLNEDGLLEHALGLALNGMTAGATRDMENDMLDDLLDDLLGEQDMMNWDHPDEGFPEDEDLGFPDDDIFDFFTSTYEDEWDYENGNGGGFDDDDDDAEWEIEEMSLGMMGYYGEDYGLAELEEEYLAEHEFTTARRGNPPPRPILLSTISPLHAEMFRVQFRGLEYDEKYMMQRTFAHNALDINENNMTYDEEEDGMDLDIDYDEESDEELYLPEEYRSRSLS